MTDDIEHPDADPTSGSWVSNLVAVSKRPT